MHRPLLLASGSPRRRELLAFLGLPFIVRPADVVEDRLADEKPVNLVQRLSKLKAKSVDLDENAHLSIGADTVVELDGGLLGKPLDEADAVRMLLLLRGRMHNVYSSLTVWDWRTGLTVSELSESHVWMREYSMEAVEAYVNSGDPLDKAGAYAIQHRLFAPVAKWEGCYTGIMGLPLGHLARALGWHGILVPRDVAAACAEATGAVCCLCDGAGAPRRPSA